MVFKILKLEIVLISFLSLIYLLFDIVLVALNIVTMLLFIYTIISIAICEFDGTVIKS